ncbi:MAG TPA: potassium channel family protein [Methylophilaceae bacterium]|jgi:voltage-gated potassium channel
MSVRLHKFLGISGVDPNERPIAVKWGRWLEWPILAVALWIPIQLYLEKVHVIDPDDVVFYDFVIWLIFALETSFMTLLVRDKARYLKGNWLNLVIICAGLIHNSVYSPVAAILRNLRLILMLYLLVKVSRRLREFLSTGKIPTILAISATVVALSGIIVTHLDPSMGDVGDGVWWAWVTMTHTGFGDIVPTTVSARIFAAILIFVGVVLISLMTAHLSVFLIGSEVEKVEDSVHQVGKDEKLHDAMLKDMAVRLDRIEKLLEAQFSKQE